MFVIVTPSLECGVRRVLFFSLEKVKRRGGDARQQSTTNIFPRSGIVFFFFFTRSVAFGVLKFIYFFTRRAHLLRAHVWNVEPVLSFFVSLSCFRFRAAARPICHR